MKSNLSQRVMTGVPLAILAIGYIYLVPEIGFILISLVVALIGTWEYGKALKNKDIPIILPVLYFSVTTLLCAYGLVRNDFNQYGMICLFSSIGVIVITSIIQIKKMKSLILWYLLPLFWIAAPIILFIQLRFTSSQLTGSNLILFIIAIAAFNDIFAFFGGKKFGKHPLAPTISPKKTIEGSVFGIMGGLFIGWAISYFLLPAYIFGWKLLLIIVVTIVASQIGDLFESKIKRYCMIKDSSKLIPGHGGLLDRIDAYLFAIPVFWISLKILNINVY